MAQTVTTSHHNTRDDTGGEHADGGVVWWTGVEVRALRQARQLTVAEFAADIGVAARAVRAWEAGAASVSLRPPITTVLDTALQHASIEARQAFHHATGTAADGRIFEGAYPLTFAGPIAIGTRHLPVLHEVDPAMWNNPHLREALAQHDIATIYRALQNAGMRQRRMAQLAGQSQSEVCEVLGGRAIRSYDLLVRIADGLSIPRGLLGLAHCTCPNHRCRPKPRRRMWWHELARDLVTATLTAHTPDTVRMICRACLADTYIETWPCDEAVHAATALDLLDALR